jgi:hypothetical protein
VHALLFSGQRALGELFSGFEQELTQAGAVPLRVGLDVRVERPGYDLFPQRDLGWLSYALSRPALERIVRARVESLTNTTLRQRCRVQKILATADGALACASKAATEGTRQLRRISSSTPPATAPLRSRCCNRSACLYQRRRRLALIALCHMRLCHPG